MTDPPFTVFVDESCPVCSREALWLRRRDRSQELRLVDISARDFDAAREAGTDPYSLMRRIHGRTSEGRVLVGVEVFRHIYSRLGFERLVRFSRWPMVRPLLAVAYEVFALARFRWALACSVSARPPRVRDTDPQKEVQVS